jgi:apolipoprotein D and lipocalin family protein
MVYPCHQSVLPSVPCSWSLVAGPDRDYLWILARDKTLPAKVRQQILSQARGLGFATDKLIWVDHQRADTD